jgi:hypothetical protein
VPKPNLELRGDDDPIVHRPPLDARAAPIFRVRALFYSPEERKLVNLTLPVWLLRMGAGDRLSFMDEEYNIDSDRMHLSFADVERHGPGLILDGVGPHQALILIWTE